MSVTSVLSLSAAQPPQQSDIERVNLLLAGDERASARIEEAGCHGAAAEIDASGFVDATVPAILFADTDAVPWVGNIPTEADRLAAIAVFGLDGKAVGRARSAGTVAELLAVALESGTLAAVVDGVHPVGTAAAVAACLRIQGKPPRGAAVAPGQSSSDDVAACYRLFLGRDPESPDVAQARPNASVLDTSMAFLTSPEFREAIAQPALDGKLWPRPKPSSTLVDWARANFDTGHADGLGHYALLACVLRTPEVSARLAAGLQGWPSGPVAAALDRVPLPLVDHLTRNASGLAIVEAENMEPLAGGRRLAFTSDDPWISFSLTGHVATSAFVELLLQASFDEVSVAGASCGKLYLDYGAGFAENQCLDLAAGRDGVCQVVIAAAPRLRWARWDPANRPGNASIAQMTARPSSARLIAASRFNGVQEAQSAVIEALAGEAGADALTPVAVALSRALTPRVLTGLDAWLFDNEPSGAVAKRLWANQLSGLTRRPRISVLVPAYNTPPRLLREMIDSVIDQVYPDWELCIADDASTEPHVAALLAAYADADPRIKVTLRDTNGHISAASNSALALVTGEWTVLLDHDDVLSANALLAVALEAVACPDAQLIYSDEDKIDDRGRRFDAFFKPDFAPELLLAQNYFNHLTAHRTEQLRAVDGWRIGMEGSQDYDITLRILERIKPRQVRHIPEILYHWRATEGSTALNIGEKNYAVEAGLQALRQHLDRTSPESSVEILPTVPWYRVRHPLPNPQPLISLIIPTRDKAEVLRVAIDSIIDRSTYRNYEILIVDNGSREAETFELFERFERDPRIRVLPYHKSFNYSALNNHGARAARGGLLALVNNDVEVISPDWMEEMASWALRDDIGCVGAKLLYPDHTIQHAGVIVGVGGVAAHAHARLGRDDNGYFGRLAVHHNVSAVTAACLLVRRSVYEAVGGFDERLAIAFNDVDFCLRVREAGYRHVLTPFAELFHHESLSRGIEDTSDKLARFNEEVSFMHKRWTDTLTVDPLYSPNLSYATADFTLGRSRFARRRNDSTSSGEVKAMATAA